MREQFDSCSYDELTAILRHRLNGLREYRRFRASTVSVDFPEVRAALMGRTWTYEREIRRLLRMRRILKRSPRKNWDSDYHQIPGAREYKYTEVVLPQR